MGAVIIGIIVVAIGLILAGWVIGHYGTSRRRSRA